MPDTPLTTLYYVHDPMCSWCWGFRPVWNQFKQQLPSSVSIVSLVGGLAPDSDAPMEQSMQHNIQATWKQIQQDIPGTEFNFDFWKLNQPRRSTYPACRAVITARQLADKADEMTLAIQQAYYLNAQNPSNMEILESAADKIELDKAQFRTLMASGQINQLLAAELTRVRDLGVTSFPSLVLQHQDALHDIHIDYRSAANMLKQLYSVLDSARP